MFDKIFHRVFMTILLTVIGGPLALATIGSIGYYMHEGVNLIIKAMS